MALSTLKPRVGTLAPRLKQSFYTPGNETERDASRIGREPWRRWYRIKRWRDIRTATFVRDLFTCQMCDKLEPDTSKLICDHIDPHHGSERLFWDPNNLQCLCKPCHDSEKQRQERRHRAR